MTILPLDPSRPDWRQVRRAAMAVRRGEVVAVPTDTVYGLAANPFDRRAVSRVFQLKRRPETKPILLLVDDWRRMAPLIRGTPAVVSTIARKFWPGPLTVILPASSVVPDIITAGTGNVAIRCPRSAFIQALSRSLGSPVTGTSANLSGLAPATTAQEALRQFGGRLCYVVDGGRASGRQVSTIVDLTAEPRIVRPGAVPRYALEPFLR
jgi:L-threonylcarbamoyladenylate synthase